MNRKQENETAAGRRIFTGGAIRYGGMQLSPDGGDGGELALDESVKRAAEKPEVEVPKRTVPKNESDLADALEGLRYHAAELHKRDEYKGEVLQKIVGEIKKLFLEMRANHTDTEKRLSEQKQIAEEAQKLARNGARTAPDWSDAAGPMLRSLPMSAEPENKRMGKEHWALATLPQEVLQERLDEPTLRAVKVWRRQADDLAILDAAMLTQGGTRRQRYLDAGGWKILRGAEAYIEQTNRFQRTLLGSTTDLAGDQWVPTGTLSSLMEDVRALLQVVNQVQQVPMPTNPYDLPVLGTPSTSYLAAESATTAGTITGTVTNLETLKATLTAKMHMAYSVLTREVDQDSIIPMIPTIRADFAYALAYGLEKAYVNGDTLATMDLGDAPGATDTRIGFNGFRKAAHLTGVSSDCGGAITVDGLIPLIGGMGKYARLDMCFWATGYVGMARLLTLKDSNGNPLVLTVDKLGAAATLLTGQLGLLLGYPVIVSDPYPSNMDATGYITSGTGTKTAMHLINRTAFIGGQRQGLEIESSNDYYFLANQTAVKATMRPALVTKVTASSTKTIAAMAYNIAGF